MHVAIADQDLWTQLGRLHLGRTHGCSSIEFYNSIDRAAQALLNEAERAHGTSLFDGMVVEGDGAQAQRLLVHFVRRAALAGARPNVYASPETTEAVIAPLMIREPWLKVALDLSVERHPSSASEQAVALVSMDGSDSLAMARGLALCAGSMRQAVYVAVKGQQTDALLRATGARDIMQLVSVDYRALSEEFLQQSGRELMARVRHEDYVAQELAKGSTIEDNPSLVKWDDLPSSLKESNRRFADSVAEVVQELGGQLAPLRSMTGRAPALEAPDVLERLARDEHDRWMTALHTDGWRHAPGPKDPIAKTHPLLVPWSQLPEPEREKDRDAIRAIPRMLGRVGFEIDVSSPLLTPDVVQSDAHGLGSVGHQGC